MRGAAWTECLLRAYGQAFFCANPISGALFALAILAADPGTFARSLVGLLAATAVSRACRLDAALTKSGLYGFNGLLLGLYWGVFREQSWAGLAVLAALAAASPIVTAACVRILSGPTVDLPVLCLPSLLLMVPLLVAMRGAPGFETAPGYLVWELDKVDYRFWERLLHWGDIDGRAVWGAISAGAATKVLLLLGVLAHSRILAGMAVLGLAVSIAAGWLLGGNYAVWNGALHFHVSVPLAMALGGFFVALNRSAVLLTLVAVLLGAPAWHGVSKGMLALGLPAYGVPFTVLVLGVLALLRYLPATAAKLGLARIPLAWVGDPEESASWNRRFRFADRFWKEVRSLRGTPAGEVDRLVEVLLRSRRVVAMTGAGVSTESGIPDYRTHEVAWKKYDASHFRWEAFLASEESRRRYWEMSEDFFHLVRNARPNGAHLALAELERLGRLDRIVTQNVDNLHQRAGTSIARVIELHGNELSVSCLSCGKRYDRAEVHRWIEGGVAVPYCLACRGILKPDSTAFGQPMPLSASQAALDAVSTCDCLLVLGTSLEVQPAAYLPWRAKSGGAALAIVTKTPTRYDIHADIVIRADVSEVVRGAVSRLKLLLPLLEGAPAR